MSKNHQRLIHGGVGNEDTVQCFFFVPSSHSDQISWDLLCSNINGSIKSLSEEYIWHKEEFKVFLPLNKQNSEDCPLHIASSTCFGDNIEDEWFIVYIVLALSNLYKDLIIQIKDGDGDFLLIEAADYLPQWAKPETTENRVFIHNNHIHLIPPNVADLDENLTLNDATQLICKYSDKTQISTEIEASILKRVGNYPEKNYENIHNALVEVPLQVAALLKLKPKLIAPLTDAYCHHDAIDAKSFKKESTNNWITIRVKFTKCLYAMLLYSKMAKVVRQPIEKDKKKMLGMKLAYGFQIIMNNSSDILSSKEYHKFINSLKANGYFKDNFEGSEQYKILLKNANDFFSSVECSIASNISHEITQIITTDEYLKTIELLQNENAKVSNVEEDNDDWLTIHPEQLNDLLNTRYGKKSKFHNGDILTPETITTELKNFLKQTSDFEGIETNNKDHLENCINFDADEFVDCVEKMLKLLSSNNDAEDIESIDSEFGEHTMSQSEDEDEADKELRERLHGVAENYGDNKIVLENMIKSMKEERATMGPSSNLISNVGFNKTDFLDSDDDD